jgi:hypothetical protein
VAVSVWPGPGLGQRDLSGTPLPSIVPVQERPPKYMWPLLNRQCFPFPPQQALGLTGLSADLYGVDGLVGGEGPAARPHHLSHERQQQALPSIHVPRQDTLS